MDALDWLLDSDPALRWQVLRDLSDASAQDVAAERARVATEGWRARLLAEQAADGRWDGGTYQPGWVDDNRPYFDAWTATSSLHSTICAVEGLLAWERSGGVLPGATEARSTGEEYLLERGLFRRRSDGAVADPRMTMLSYPVRWFHDVLRGLEHFRVAGRRDPRLSEGIDLVRSKADRDGRWALENVHEGPTLFSMDEREGTPSRWVTLRAMRVLTWWDSSN